MTSPEGRAGITPGPLQDAVSIDGSDLSGRISGLPLLDQATAEQILKDIYIQSNPHIDVPLADIYAELRSGVPLTLALIESLVKAIIAAPPSQVFLSIGHANSIVQAFIGGINNSVTVHTEAIANLEEITAAMNTTVAYVGDMQDMVTVPRFAVVSVGPAGQKSVDVVAPFSVLDLLFSFQLPTHKPQVYLLGSLGDIYYTPIVVDRKGTVDKIRWIAGADASIFAIDYYEMALCVYNPANGNVEKVWGSGNIKDGVANTSTLAEVQISMGISQRCTPGQILFIAHQQVAPGLLQLARSFAAMPQGRVGRPAVLLLDAGCYVAPGHSLGIPSSIPLESLTRENRFIPWGAISVISDPV